MHPKHMLIGKMLIVFVGRVLYILCLHPYNSNFRYLEIKPLVLRTLH